MTEKKGKKKTTDDTVPEEEIMDKGDVFKMFDEADEEQIEAELKGAVADEMVYSFSVGGQKITGLTKAGTWAVMRAYNKAALFPKKTKGSKTTPKPKPIIRLGEVKDGVLTESEQGYGFVANASLIDPNTGTVLENGGGGSEASKKDRNGRQDPFALAKAIAKAQRNAIRVMLPNDLVEKYITKWSKQDRVRQFMNRPTTPDGKPMNCEDCGDPLTRKAVDYYIKNPDKPKRCYPCNMKRRGKSV